MRLAVHGHGDGRWKGGGSRGDTDASACIEWRSHALSGRSHWLYRKGRDFYHSLCSLFGHTVSAHCACSLPRRTLLSPEGHPFLSFSVPVYDPSKFIPLYQHLYFLPNMINVSIRTYFQF